MQLDFWCSYNICEKVSTSVYDRIPKYKNLWYCIKVIKYNKNRIGHISEDVLRKFRKCYIFDFRKQSFGNVLRHGFTYAVDNVRIQVSQVNESPNFECRIVYGTIQSSLDVRAGWEPSYRGFSFLILSVTCDLPSSYFICFFLIPLKICFVYAFFKLSRTTRSSDILCRVNDSILK